MSAGSRVPGVHLSLAGGSRAFVALQGAQPLSWIAADGSERLYLSPRAATDGQTAIRGGIPLCFPQFNQRGPVVKHGFARNAAWTVVPQDRADVAVLELRDSVDTRAAWPYRFCVRMTVTLTADGLRTACAVANTGSEAFDFTLALHTYLAVDDVAAVALDGLSGAAWWDAVRDERHAADPAQAGAPLAIRGETDRVYSGPPPGAGIRLHAPGRALAITHSDTLTETIVWNPGPALCATLGDMPADGWRRMLCVEAGRIDVPVRLAAGDAWQGWQHLTVVRP